MMVDGNAGPRRELRFAVVLYGGVSLCIYMHGTTKEMNRLVSASAVLAAGLEVKISPSETVYRELLEWIAERDHVRTEVSVDVIAGTSAGGINGVYLAKALANNLSQDRLRDLWLERGDTRVGESQQCRQPDAGSRSRASRCRQVTGLSAATGPSGTTGRGPGRRARWFGR